MVPFRGDRSPKGREGRLSNALGPLGGKIAASGRDFMPREPVPGPGRGTPVLAGDGHAEASGILHLVGVQHVLAFARESPEVRVEQGVAEYDEQGLVVACVGEREAYRLPQALRVALEYGAGLAPFGFARQVAVHGFGLVAGDEDGLGGRELPGIAHNPVDDGLSADGQQALGQVVGVGAHAFALAGNGQNDLHVDSFLLWGKCRNMFALMRRAAPPNRLRRPSQDGTFFLLRVARWVGTDAGCKKDGCQCGLLGGLWDVAGREAFRFRRVKDDVAGLD